MAEKKIVKLYGVRHGKNEGDQLTPAGQAEIIDSMRNNVAVIGDTVHAVYVSLRKRTQQSAEAARISGEFKNFPAEFRPRAGFDYHGVPGITNTKAILAVVEEVQGDAPETIGIWRQGAPAWMKYLEPRVFGAVVDAAIELAVEFEGMELTGLIFSHSPVIDVPAPDNFPRLRTGDIILTEVEVVMDNNGNVISTESVSCTYIPRGF